MLVVTAFLLIIGSAVLTMHTSTRKLEIGYDNKSRLYYMAESGLDAGVARYKNEKSFPSFSINSTGEPIITCKVNLQKNIPSSGKDTIEATATCNGISKKVSKVFSSFNGPSLTKSTIIQCGGNFAIGNGDNKNTNSNGSVYIQSNDSAGTYIGQNLNVSNGGLTIVNKIGDVDFDRKTTDTSSISGSVFIENLDPSKSVQIQKNMDTAGDFTILTKGDVSLFNDQTINSVHGNVYINSGTKFYNGQRLNVDKDLTVENNNGDMIFDNNYYFDAAGKNINNINVTGSVYLYNYSNTNSAQLHNDFHVGNNFTANANGNVDIVTKDGNTAVGDYSVKSNNNSITCNGASIKTTNGDCYFKASNSVSITRSSGYNFNIGGNYFVNSGADINNTQNIMCNFPHYYYETAGGIIKDSNFGNDNVINNNQIYRKDSNGFKTGSQTSVPDTVKPNEHSTTLYGNTPPFINPNYTIGTVKSGAIYNTWNISHSHVAGILVDGSNTNDVISALEDTVYSANKYKVIVIKGDYSMNWYETSKLMDAVAKKININNTIIYCTGAFKLNNLTESGSDIPIYFNYSVVYGKSVSFQSPNKITMTAPNIVSTDASIPVNSLAPLTQDDVETDINSILDEYLTGYDQVAY